MNNDEEEIWAFLHRHLQSIFNRDAAAYQATTAADLSLYEWFITPHRQDGLDFHLFMIANSWAGTQNNFRYDLWEPRLQCFGDTAIVTYTFMLTLVGENGLRHRSHNETRVLVKREGNWQVVHVHKSPAGPTE